LRNLKNKKTAGIDEIQAEFGKKGGEKVKRE